MTKEHVPQSSAVYPLRIGLIVDDVNTSKYIYNFANWANSQQHTLKVYLLLHNSIDLSDSGEKAKSLTSMDHRCSAISKAFFRVITKIETRLLSKDEQYKSHLDTFDLSSFQLQQISLEQILPGPGPISAFYSDDVHKNINLDLIINYGRAPLPADIFRASRSGLISIHYGDERSHRGGPAGFWEIYSRQDTTAFAIQRIKAVDGADTLMRGHIRTSFYYLLNQAKLFTRANYCLQQLVLKIAATGSLPNPVLSFPFSNRPFSVPTPYQAIKYLIKMYAVRIQKALRQKTAICCRWQVGYINADWPDAVLWRSTTISVPRSRFLADPFVVSMNDRHLCFVEDYDFKTWKGKIDVYDLTESKASRVGTALEEPFHLSFPYIFEYQQQLYMCPEFHRTATFVFTGALNFRCIGN